jgi:plastocyanin
MVIDNTTHKAAGMKLDVTVVPQGSPGPGSQAGADAQGNTERDALIAEGLTAAAGFKLSSAKLTDGSTTWGATVGGYGDALGQADISRFTPGNINVNVGDTVTWTNDTLTPHTARPTSRSSLRYPFREAGRPSWPSRRAPCCRLVARPMTARAIRTPASSARVSARRIPSL